VIRRSSAAPHLRALAVLAVLVGACSPTTSATPATSQGAADPAPVLGCLGIGAAECQLVVDHLLPQLPEGRGRPFAVAVYATCPNEAPCPPGLAVRDGSITVEYADAGNPLQFFVDGPAFSPAFGPVNTTWSGLIQPSSGHVAGPGPFPFELGHCGLLWQVDFDGSFWLPIGEIDADAPELINQDTGQMRLLDLNLAEYRSANGFVATLARYPGPKHVWLCD
jgi:hypothetical protein